MKYDKQYVLDRIVVNEDDCWIWQKSTNSKGYGTVGRKPYLASRLAWALWTDLEPGGQLRYTCGEPKCCNPEHLEEIVKKPKVLKGRYSVNRDKQYILDRILEDEGGCWVWQKARCGGGYGELGVPPYGAHKLSYLLWRGEVPEGMFVRHMCHNRPCCNPAHLEIGTPKENWWDSEEVHRAAAFRRREIAA